MSVSTHYPAAAFASRFTRALRWAALAGSFLLLSAIVVFAQAPQTILNVSYDVSRELYKEINPAFVKVLSDKPKKSWNAPCPGMDQAAQS